MGRGGGVVAGGSGVVGVDRLTILPTVPGGGGCLLEIVLNGNCRILTRALCIVAPREYLSVCHREALPEIGNG